MASIYQRPNSPFWWIKHRDALGKIVRESTSYRVGIGNETRKARNLCAEKTLEEMRSRPERNRRDHFEHWVIPFFQQTYANSPKTLTKYLSCWNAITVFFKSREIFRPVQVTRADVIDFLDWRQKPAAVGVRAVCRNSALLDLRILRLVLFEAMNREYCASNPAARLKLKPDRPRKVDEFNDEQIDAIRKALADAPEWMRISFEIAMHQGCRFFETSVSLAAVNLATREITFTIKRGTRHTTKLHPSLLPLFERLIKEGREKTFEMPKNATRDWSRFFRRKLKMENVSFRSTRVSVITRMARSGVVSEQQAMRFIGHSRSTTHEIYQRLKAGDLDACVTAVDIPKSS